MRGGISQHSQSCQKSRAGTQHLRTRLSRLFTEVVILPNRAHFLIGVQLKLFQQSCVLQVCFSWASAGSAGGRAFQDSASTPKDWSCCGSAALPIRAPPHEDRMDQMLSWPAVGLLVLCCSYILAANNVFAYRFPQEVGQVSTRSLPGSSRRCSKLGFQIQRFAYVDWRGFSGGKPT